MIFNMEDKKLTDEELYLLCEAYENEKMKQVIVNDVRDKGVDYEFWQLMYKNGLDLK